MTDPIPTPDNDDLIRRALEGEAEGVQASDELLDRTMEAVRRPAVPPYRRLLAAAAIAAVVIGAGVALVRDDGAHEVDAVDDPTTTTTDPVVADELGPALLTLFPCPAAGTVQLSLFVDTDGAGAVRAALEGDERTLDVVEAPGGDVEAALQEVAGDDRFPIALNATFATGDDELAVRSVVSDLPGVLTTSTLDCDQGGPTDAPTLMALVREDGWLVVIDLPTGEARELHFGGDPEAPPSGQEEGGPQFIDGVDLSPDRQWIYFSTCCEPASGMTFRISVDGGEPEPIAMGAYPRVSPDGRFVATATSVGVSVTRLDDLDAVPADAFTDCCPRGLAWSPDGRQLAGVRSLGMDDVPQVVLLDWDGASLTVADPGKPDNPASFVSWTPDGTLVRSSGGPVDGERSLSQDSTYEWLLWVDEEGAVLGQDGHESSARPPVEGVPQALDADW